MSGAGFSFGCVVYLKYNITYTVYMNRMTFMLNISVFFVIFLVKKNIISEFIS